MHRSRRPFTALLFTVPALLLALALAAASPAQARRDQVELTPYVAYRFGGEIEGNDDFFRRGDTTDIDESEAFGVTLDIPMEAGFKLQLLVSHQESEAALDEGLFEPSLDLGDINVTYGHVGLLYEWGIGHVSPYVVGSLGGTLLDPGFPGADDETRFSLGLGGGVKLFLSEHIGIRLEGRGFWTDVTDDDRYRYGDDGDALFQGEVSAGLLFAW